MDWRAILRKNFTSWLKLAEFLELSQEQKDAILKNPRFSLNLPLRLAEKIKKGTLEDPILKQFLPDLEETIADGFEKDPVGDLKVQHTSSLLQKYQHRVLLLTTSACAMHCRFCFRQNYPYEKEKKAFELEAELLLKDPSIEEVILSGGDPLSLSNRALEELFQNLKKIKHIKRVRFHTRFPIGIPERLDAELLQIFEKVPFKIYFVIHANHPHELDEDIFKSLNKLQRLGIPILNQAVLLKGVNDQEKILQNLFGSLADRGILAYYLHQLDKVAGAKRFEVSVQEGLKLMKKLEETLPGYAVPKYVREISGELSKTSLHSFHCSNT